MKKVLILEDHQDAQKWLGLAVTLAFPGIAVHCCDRLSQAIALLVELNPDLCLVDLKLPDGSGVDFITHCRQNHPEIQLVVTTLFDDDQHLFPAINAGAQGYLLKEEPREVISQALQGLTHGTPPLSGPISRRILNHVKTTIAQPESTEENADLFLSKREQEMLTVIAKGYKTAEAAELLGVSYHTAARHVKNIYSKLDINSRAEATQQALRLGLLKDS